MAQNEAILEEYKSLRDEIGKRQEARLFILGFTVAAIGTIIGPIFSSLVSAGQSAGYIAFALFSFALALIIAALLLTIQYTLSIMNISVFIRLFIESQISGIEWETRRFQLRQMGRAGRRGPWVPYSTSKSLSVYYAFLALIVLLAAFAACFRSNPFAFIPLLFLFALACFYALDLYRQKSPRWDDPWEQVTPGESSGSAPNSPAPSEEANSRTKPNPSA